MARTDRNRVTWIQMGPPSAIGPPRRPGLFSLARSLLGYRPAHLVVKEEKKKPPVHATPLPTRPASRIAAGSSNQKARCTSSASERVPVPGKTRPGKRPYMNKAGQTRRTHLGSRILARSLGHHRTSVQAREGRNSGFITVRYARIPPPSTTLPPSLVLVPVVPEL